MKWTATKTYGVKPRPRCRHSANFAKGKIFVFGGNDSDMSFNDVFYLNVKIHVPESTLARDFAALLKDARFADVAFLVDGEEVRAHRSILAARSEVFHKMFTTGMRESQETQITLEDIKAEPFRLLLSYLYTDEIELDVETAEALLVASSRFDIPRLKLLCENYLSTVIDSDNLIDVLHLSDMYGANELRP